MIRAGGWWSGAESLIKEVVVNVGSGLADWRLKSALTGRLFALSRNWLTSVGHFPQSQQGPDVKTSAYRK